jgi:enamidase
MADAASTAKSGKVVIRDIGLLLSGDIDRPILDADTIVIHDGVISAVGKEADVDTDEADTLIDARRTCVAPGLIDSHVHPVFGDWTPRQSQLGWIDSTMNGGVTTMISAGEVHLPGRPKDIVGLKALAITAQRAFDNFRPGGVKVLAGAPVIEKGMVESDFKELAESGVSLLGEIGLGSVKGGTEAATMVKWARAHGIQSTIHTGGPSIPGSGLIDKDVVLEADADIIGHINGGHTALPEAHVCELCEKSSRAIEIVHNGNEKIAIAAARMAIQLKCPHRVILGTDGPGRLRRAAARHPAHDRTAVGHRGHRARARVLLRDRQHRAHPRPELRPDRTRPRRRLRLHGPGPAHRRQDAAGERAARRHSRHRHGDDRRHRALRPQPQHAAGHRGAGGGGRALKRAAPTRRSIDPSTHGIAPRARHRLAVAHAARHRHRQRAPLPAPCPRHLRLRPDARGRAAFGERPRQRRRARRCADHDQSRRGA